MKALLFLLLVAMVAHGAESKHATTTLTLKNGKVFRSVKITSETDDAIFVRYNAGIVKIFKSELSAEMQKEYPTLQQREKVEAEHQQKETARIRAERDAEAAENLLRNKADHASTIARITKSAPAEREIKGEHAGQAVSWTLRFDDPGRNLWFASIKTPASGPREERFVYEIPAEDFQAMVSLVRKFESWSSICSKETPKPTVEKSIGNLGTVACMFRYNKNTGGTLFIGPDAIQEVDAKHFLALSTVWKDLAAENLEIQQKNQAIADRLK